MNNTLHITVLVENSASRRGLKAEHGWACLIEVNGRRVLFDTGQTDLLLNNARALGCALDNLDAIVLSHGHYDHTGGLAAVNALAPAARLFFHPAALAPKYTARADGSADDIGLPATARETLANRDAAVVMTRVSREIVPGLLVTGEIPRQTGFEDVGGRFFLDAACRQADPLLDDQAVFLPTAAGVVVVLGCAHAGVVNTLRHIEQLTGTRRIRAVLGGMHLLNASPERLEATVEAFRQREIPLLVPAHCTGIRAVARLWETFPAACATGGVGSRFTFPL
ncbi:MAG: putative hydrolase [Verrucomicrobia bacterium ADurb.Bin118]|nr:MAG: putative hydrolase [Verrucomicrobia bacterium ADurb.Bin118]